MPPLLSIRGLNVGYGDIQVLWDIDLDVHPGEIVALIGSNGAGKTTLLTTISGLLKPRSGRIDFAGQGIAALASDQIVKMGIAHVPQGRRLFRGLTVAENLLQGAYSRRDKAGIRDDFERVLGLLPRLKERIRQVAGTMSGGEQQMVAIGRGLMARPRLLLIDELSLGLAPLVVDQLMSILAQVNRDGTTILLVEQDVQVALEAAHRGYVLETGRMVLGGPATQLLENPHMRQAYLGL